MGKHLQNLAQRIKEQISKEIVPITVIGKRGTGKTSLLYLVNLSVRPYAWHHATDKHGNLLPTMKKDLQKA